MKRYLTVGFIFSILVAIIVTISWLAFPAWHDPASGGFLALLGATIIGVLAFLQGVVSIWKDLKSGRKELSSLTPPKFMQSIESQRAETIYNAPGGTINLVQQEKQNEPSENVKSDNDANGIVETEEEVEPPRSTVVDGLNWDVTRPSIIFDGRLRDAFPGLRGTEKFQGEDAINRLEILLRNPLSVDSPRGGHNVPFWWFRGSANMFIEGFWRVGPERILLDVYEMHIDHIVVIREFAAEEKNFVYVQVLPDEPTGLYKYSLGWLERYLQEQLERNYGYYVTEEYAVWQDKLIKREEYDDGAAIVNGKPTQTRDANLRVRYLSPYNFVIGGQDHVLNSPGDIDSQATRLLNEILLGSKTIDDFVSFVTSLPKISLFKA